MNKWKTTTIWGLVLAMGLTGIARAEDKNTQNKPAAEPPKAEKQAEAASDAALNEQIDSLITNLDADNIKIREQASEELKKIGKPALSALQEASESDNPEVAWRAKIIINAINRAEWRKSIQQGRPEPPDIKSQPRSRGFSNSFSITIGPGASSYQLQQDANGKITVTITETKDGKQVTNTYTANSAEEFKEKYPEVAKKYGIDVGANRSRIEIEVPEIDLGEIWDDFGKSWGRRWNDFEKEMEQMRKMMKDWTKRSWNPWFGSQEEESQPPKQAQPQGGAAGKEGAGQALDVGAEIEFIEPPLRAQLNLEETGGVMVASVEEGGLSGKIGLKQYDVVLSINGAKIVTVWEFRRLMKSAVELGKVKLEIIRQGKKQALEWDKK